MVSVFYQVSYESISCLAFLSILCILGLYIRHLKLQEVDEKEEEFEEKTGNILKSVQWLPICTIGCFLSYLIMDLLACLEVYAGSNFCFKRTQLFCICLGLNRFFIYNVYVLRLELIFKNCAYGYGSKVLNGLRLINFVVLVGFASITPRFVRGVPSKISDCVFEAPVWYAFSFLLGDIGINVICLGLFLRPLFKVLTTSSDSRLRFVAIKCTVLTTVSTLSTIVGVISAGTSLHLFHLNRIDDVVESLCLLLMNNTYKDWYEFLCTGCIVCCKPPLEIVEKGMVMSEQLAIEEAQNVQV